MEIERPKIQFYKERSFGEKFSATFEFIRENFKLWLRLCTYLLLPLCLIQGMAMESFMGFLNPAYVNILGGAGGMDASAAMLVRLGLSYCGYLICTLLGSIILVTICYSMIKYYQDSPDRLRNVTFDKIKPLLFKYFKRALGITLLLFFLVVFVFGMLLLLTMLSGALGVLLIIAAGVCLIPLSLVMPVYVFEEKQNIFSSITRGLNLGFHSFWSLFGLMFVMGFLANILSSITTIPWYLMTMVKTLLFATSSPEVSLASSPLYNFALYLASVFMNYGMYITMSLSTLALAYHYGSVAEEKDGVSVEEDIQHFEQLAEKDSDIENFDKL